MTAGTEWREPPAKDARKRWAGIGPVMAEIAAELRTRPGEWKCVKTFPEDEMPNARQMGTNINTGRYSAFRPQYHYEARTRTELVKDPNGIDLVVVNVYACYVGESGHRYRPRTSLLDEPENPGLMKVVHRSGKSVWRPVHYQRPGEERGLCGIRNVTPVECEETRVTCRPCLRKEKTERLQNARQ